MGCPRKSKLEMALYLEVNGGLRLEIIVAKTSGFCFGVSRAIRMVEDSLEKDSKKKIYSLGPIIHNRQVVEDFKNKGVEIIEQLDQAQKNAILIIRAHGISPEVYEQIKENNIEVVDTTCPFVSKIHSKVSECSKSGYSIVIVGDRSHPEVVGIKGWDKDAVVVENEDEAAGVNISGKACVVAQTTLSEQKWDKICSVLKERIAEPEFFNTICSATSDRQREARDIAGKVDVMFVIGDPNSSNTRKLLEIGSEYCPRTYLIENASQLDVNILKENDRVGVTAGASTPDWIIEEVIGKMNQINKTADEELNFEKMYEESMRVLHDGDIVKGRVIRASDKEVFVDLGYKADGIIPQEEISDNPDQRTGEVFKAGDEIEVYIMKVNDGEGNVLLSKKRIEYIKGWDRLAEAYSKGELVEGFVSEVVNSGVIALVSGVRVFIPASQLSDRHVDDLSKFVKKPVTLKILEFNRQKKKVIGSHKVVLQKETEEARKNLWENIEVGQILTGTVKRLTDFGAFVDIGGMDGLIHISQLSWNRIKHPSEVVKEGQQVEVSILDINKEKGKISLGYRKDIDNPWESAINRYEVGSIVKGKVVNLMPFGVFIELEPGLTGLVHISQVSRKRINKPQEVLSLGQEVEAKITEIDREGKRISLSIKEALPVIEDEAQAKNETQDEVIPDEHKEDMKVTLGDLIGEDTGAEEK